MSNGTLVISLDKRGAIDILPKNMQGCLEVEYDQAYDESGGITYSYELIGYYEAKVYIHFTFDVPLLVSSHKTLDKVKIKLDKSFFYENLEGQR